MARTNNHALTLVHCFLASSLPFALAVLHDRFLRIQITIRLLIELLACEAERAAASYLFCLEPRRACSVTEIM